MSGIFIFAVIFLAVICMVIAISKFNQHPFIVLTVVAIAVGLVCGIPTEEVINTVKSGFGNILASIGIVILCGTIIGTILEKTGAALTMANTILKLVGRKNSVLTMAITGYITGIPVFCDSGFVILSPISRALASQSNVSLAVMATALSGGLYAPTVWFPPHPAPSPWPALWRQTWVLPFWWAFSSPFRQLQLPFSMRRRFPPRSISRQTLSTQWMSCSRNTASFPALCTASPPSCFLLS